MYEFTHQRKRYQLSPEKVAAALDGVEPEPIQQLATVVNGRWYPVKQALVTPLGLRNSDVNSTECKRHLRNAGLLVHDTKADGPLPSVPPEAPRNAAGGRDGSSSERRDALGLAVELLKGRPSVTATEAIAAADEMVSWLRGA